MSQGHCRIAPCASAFVLACAVPSAAVGQTAGDEMGAAEQASTSAKDKPDVLFAPIPFSSPSSGSGIAAGGVVFYNPNESSHQWFTGGGLFWTGGGSKGILLGHSMYLGGDKVRIRAVAGYVRDTGNYYGIGQDAGDLGDGLELDNTQWRLDTDVELEVAPDFYLGLRYRLKTYDAAPAEDDDSATAPPPQSQLDSTMSMAGPAISYDTRDSHTWPGSGVNLSANWLFGIGALGNSFTHNKLTVDLRGYLPSGDSTVIAGRVLLCSTGGEVPYYDLCLYGSNGNVRGYKTGRWRDGAMWAAQYEVRHEFNHRWGATAFAGVGGIAPSLGDLPSDSNFLPGAGIGLRYRPFKDNDVNLRFDLAAGKDDTVIYVGVTEAF